MALNGVAAYLCYHRLSKFRIKLRKSSVNTLIYFSGENNSDYLYVISKKL